MEVWGHTIWAAFASNGLDLSLLLAGAAVALGGVVRGFAGFGAAMIIVPLLSWLYSAVEAVVVCALLELAGFLPLLPSVARHSRWDDIRPIASVSLLAVPVGVWLLVTLDPVVVRRVFSLIVLTFVCILATAGDMGAQRACRRQWVLAGLAARWPVSPAWEDRP